MADRREGEAIPAPELLWHSVPGSTILMDMRKDLAPSRERGDANSGNGSRAAPVPEPAASASAPGAIPTEARGETGAAGKATAADRLLVCRDPAGAVAIARPPTAEAAPAGPTLAEVREEKCPWVACGGVKARARRGSSNAANSSTAAKALDETVSGSGGEAATSIVLLLLVEMASAVSTGCRGGPAGPSRSSGRAAIR